MRTQILSVFVATNLVGNNVDLRNADICRKLLDFLVRLDAAGTRFNNNNELVHIGSCAAS